MSKTSVVRKPKTVSTPAAVQAPAVALAAAPAAPAATVQGCPIAAGVAAAQAAAATFTGTGPTVAAPTVTPPRFGTARHVAYQVLHQLAGQPLPIVLQALKVAETQWHTNNSRVVKGIAPSGWLRTLGAAIVQPTQAAQ